MKKEQQQLQQHQQQLQQHHSSGQPDVRRSVQAHKPTTGTRYRSLEGENNER